MRFGRLGIMRPESFPQTFNHYTQATETSDRGRETLKTPVKKTATLRGILAEARPEEQQRYNQLGVHVTHTILQRGAPQAGINDLLVLVKAGTETRQFRIEAVHDKGEMGIETAYICEERGDIP